MNSSHISSEDFFRDMIFIMVIRTFQKFTNELFLFVKIALLEFLEFFLQVVFFYDFITISWDVQFACKTCIVAHAVLALTDYYVIT